MLATMARRTPLFRPSDLTRALKAVKAAGLDVQRVDVDMVAGKVVMVTGGGAGTETATDLDKWLATHAHAPQGHQ
jgi:hypothetical protein